MKSSVIPFRPGLAGIAAALMLLAGCASAPHKMGTPFQGLDVKSARAPRASLPSLAHHDIALVLSANTRSVIDAVDVFNGADIMFNEGALPKSPTYDFDEQISSATTALFKDRFSKTVDASSLDDAARAGLRTAAVLDLQVYDSRPAGRHHYFFRTRLAVYFVDVKTRARLGEVAVERTLNLHRRELAGDAATVAERKNRLLNRVLAKSFYAMAMTLDRRLGTMKKPLVLPVAETTATAKPAAHPQIHKNTRKARREARRKRRHLMTLAKKLRRLDDLHAYGFIADDEYDTRRHELMHKYHRYLN